MALSATFTANFSSFYDAVDKADAKLKDFGEGADKVGRNLDRLSNQFSGRQVVQEATLMAKAVEEIGGISKLTEKELARLGSTANEAVAKMKALGMDVPKNLQEIADKTKGANKQTTDWMGTLSKVAGAVGIAFSVDAVVDFIGSIFDAASAIKDLSQQWGVSMVAAQQFTSAAKLSGVESATVGKSIQFLTDKLGESSKEYKALLENVGLSGAALRQMPLEDAYKAVLTAITNIKDETLQLDVATALLGPSAKQMIGAIRDGYVEAIAKQKAWSDDQVARLAAAGEAWEKFKDLVVLYSGEILAAMMKNSDTITKSWGNFFTTIGKAAKDWATGNWVDGATAAFLKNEQAAERATTGLDGLAASMKPLSSHGVELTGKIKTQAEVLADLAKQEQAAKLAQQARTAALAASKADQDAYNKQVDAYRKSITDLNNTLSGGGLIANANLYLEALKDSIPVQDMTRKAQDAINKVMLDAIEVYEAAGREVPQAIRDMASATEAIVPLMIQKRDQLKDVWKDFKLIDLGQVITLDPAPPKAGMFDGMAKGLSSALTTSVLKAIQGGGSILQAAGSAVGNFLLDPKQSGVGKAISTAASKLPAFMGGAISAAIPAVGAFIGPAISWLSTKITSWFGKKEHEKLRDSFIEAAGGMKVLGEAAQLAGVDLDELMRARNTDKVKGAITEIEEALRFQATALDAAMEAATRYGFTIEELGPAMQRQELDKKAQQLFKDWEILNSAGIENVAITERMSEAVSAYVQQATAMGFEVPSAMRPMLEAFAKSGNLLDENGEAITDLEDAGISFAMTMSEGFQKLIDEVKKLTDAIGRSLSDAIESVPPIAVQVAPVPNMRPVPGAPVGANGLPEYQQGTGGFKNFGAGTPVMLHGWEAVVPRDNSAAFATVSSGGSSAAAAPVQVIVNAQGAFFDTPDSLQRLANRVSDALTAKYSVMGKLRAAV